MKSSKEGINNNFANNNVKKIYEQILISAQIIQNKNFKLVMNKEIFGLDGKIKNDYLEIIISKIKEEYEKNKKFLDNKNIRKMVDILRIFIKQHFNLSPDSSILSAIADTNFIKIQEYFNDTQEKNVKQLKKIFFDSQLIKNERSYIINPTYLQNSHSLTVEAIKNINIQIDKFLESITPPKKENEKSDNKGPKDNKTKSLKDSENEYRKKKNMMTIKNCR